MTGLADISAMLKSIDIACGNTENHYYIICSLALVRRLRRLSRFKSFIIHKTKKLTRCGQLLCLVRVTGLADISAMLKSIDIACGNTENHYYIICSLALVRRLR
ncbi:MAG: hypothetical protein J6Y44_00440, partial [Clostridia bacterium]|nr:hypothetical protein [Clostridia bacterium]